MTWKDFKATVEAAGVRDEDEIQWIDLWYPYDSALSIDRGKHGVRIERSDGTQTVITMRMTRTQTVITMRMTRTQTVITKVATDR